MDSDVSRIKYYRDMPYGIILLCRYQFSSKGTIATTVEQSGGCTLTHTYHMHVNAYTHMHALTHAHTHTHSVVNAC